MPRPIVKISLRDYESRRQEIAKELWRAATDVGFFYLTDFGISPQEIAAMFAMSKAFFALPADVKGRYGFDQSKNVGWESGRQKRQSHALPELKESMQLKWHDMAGKWPGDDALQDFEATSKRFMERCQVVSEQLLECFAIASGVEPDYFVKRHDHQETDCQQTFRLMHYFSVEGKQFPKGFPRAGSHCDFETITLLFAHGPGLEVCPGREACTEFAQGDEWTECPALQDSCTVNIGDALMRWTDDKLKSNYHRVRMPKPGEDRGARYSMAYFNQANKSAVIQGKKGLYPAITAEQFVREQLAAIYVKAEA